MKFYEAYSIDLGECLNLDSAILAIEAGEIGDQKAFRCPDGACDAPLMIKAIPDPDGPAKKREPYYATAGDKKLHNTQVCEYYLVDTSTAPRKNRRRNYEDDLKNPDLDDIFDLHRRSFRKPAPECSPRSLDEVRNAKQRRTNLTHFSLVASLADRFERMSKALTEAKCLVIDRVRRSYAEAFSHATMIDARGLTGNDARIYWGEALLLKKVKPPVEGETAGLLSYVFILDTLTYQGEAQVASLTVWADRLEDYPGKKRMTRWLEDALAGKKGVRVRIFAYATFDTKGPDSKERRFINFKVKTLDHLYFYTI